MQGWGAPTIASAFWAGLLLWDLRPAPASTWPWWAWLLLGCAALAGATALAPGRRGDDPIRSVGTRRRRSVPAVAAVTPTGDGPPARARPGHRAGGRRGAALWRRLGGLGAVRAEHSLLRRLAPRTVTLLATLREDPEPSAFGWHALVDVTRASWPGGAAAVRETVVGERERRDARRPSAATGSRSRAPADPRRRRLRGHARARGLAVSVRAIEVQRIGGASSPFVRMTQVVRAFVGDTIERIFPPREAGLLLGLVLGDASKLDPVTTRDFQTTGLGHLLVVSGENVAMVLAPMLAFAGVLKSGRRRGSRSGSASCACSSCSRAPNPRCCVPGRWRASRWSGILLGKPRATGSILAAAVLALLVLDPWLVYAIGFQLSVAATAGMVALATPIAERLAGGCRRRSRWRRGRRWPPSSA